MQNMKKSLLILALIVAWSYTRGQSSYFPLEKGKTLTYAYGSELYQGEYQDIRMKVTILPTTEVMNGKEYFISETSSGSGGNYTVHATSYVRMGKDGSIIGMQDKAGEESTVIQASPTIGSTWSSRDGQRTYTATVTDLSGTITTATEAYSNCLVVEQATEDGIITRSYFKKGVGMVATTVIKDGSEKIFIYLVSE